MGTSQQGSAAGPDASEQQSQTRCCAWRCSRHCWAATPRHPHRAHPIPPRAWLPLRQRSPSLLPRHAPAPPRGDSPSCPRHSVATTRSPTQPTFWRRLKQPRLRPGRAARAGAGGASDPCREGTLAASRAGGRGRSLWRPRPATPNTRAPARACAVRLDEMLLFRKRFHHSELTTQEKRPRKTREDRAFGARHGAARGRAYGVLKRVYSIHVLCLCVPVYLGSHRARARRAARCGRERVWEGRRAARGRWVFAAVVVWARARGR